MSAADFEKSSTEAPSLPGEGGGAPTVFSVVTGKGEMFPAGRYRVIVEAKNAGLKQRAYLRAPARWLPQRRSGQETGWSAHKEWHLAIQNDGGKKEMASPKLKASQKGRHTVIHSEDWTDNDFNDLIVKAVPLQGRSQLAQGGSGKDRIRQVGGWDNDWLDAQGGGGNDRIRQRGDGGDDVLRAFGGAGRDRPPTRMVAMIAYLLEAVEVETVFVSVAAEAEMCFEQLAAVAETVFQRGGRGRDSACSRWTRP